MPSSTASRTTPHAVSYEGELERALLDMSDWVEKGIEPAKTTNYLIGTTRSSSQPKPTIVKVSNLSSMPPSKATNGPTHPNRRQGDVPCTVDIPQRQNRLVFAKWNFDGSSLTRNMWISHEGQSDQQRLPLNSTRRRLSRKPAPSSDRHGGCPA